MAFSWPQLAPQGPGTLSPRVSLQGILALSLTRHDASAALPAHGTCPRALIKSPFCTKDFFTNSSLAIGSRPTNPPIPPTLHHLHLVLPTTPNPAGHYPTDTPPACEAVLDLVPPVALANLLCHVPGLPGAQHRSLHLKRRDGAPGWASVAQASHSWSPPSVL